jgi:hypothetical protein
VEPQVLVSLASAAVAAVAILASSITTLLSLRTQRENTQATLDAQERLSTAQEQALRERSHAQDLRDKRVHPYISLIKWADRLLEALTEMSEDSNPYLSLQDWNIAPDVDNLLDLYASDTVHVRYAALRGELMGTVANSTGVNRPQIVTCDESGPNVENVKIEVGHALTEWSARNAVRLEAIDKAIKLIAQIRAEMQGQISRGYFIIWRLS